MGAAALAGWSGRSGAVVRSLQRAVTTPPSRGVVRYDMLCMVYIAAGGQVGVLPQVQPLQQIPQLTPQQQQLQAMLAGQSPQQLQAMLAGQSPQQQAHLMQQLRAAQPRPPQPGAAAQPRPQVQLPPSAGGWVIPLLRCSTALLARRPSQRRW